MYSNQAFLAALRLFSARINALVAISPSESHLAVLGLLLPGTAADAEAETEAVAADAVADAATAEDTTQLRISALLVFSAKEVRDGDKELVKDEMSSRNADDEKFIPLPLPLVVDCSGVEAETRLLVEE